MRLPAQTRRTWSRFAASDFWKRRPVCAENLIRIDLMAESPHGGDDGRADLPPVEPGYLALQAVPVGNSRSDILVMQPAQNRHGQRLTDSLDGARDRRILLQ
jgi:hypothetical protein